MTGIDDERIRFYLENQELIDTWAGLASDARSALSDWLIDLRDDVEELAVSQSALTHLRDSDRWKIHMLARQTWNHELNDDATFTVCLEWSSSTLEIPAKPPYVGLRIRGGDETARNLRTGFLKRFGDRLRAFGTYQIGNPRTWWPAWRYVVPEDERWWEHTDEYHDLLLEALERTWTDLAPIVDEWVAAPGILGD